MSLTKVSYSMITGAPVNIMDYGAVPGGDATTNTLAIQAAVDASKNVIIPEGTFAVNATIYIGHNLNLIGAGKDVSIIDASTCTGPVFTDQLNRYGPNFYDQGLRSGLLSRFKIIGNTASATNDLMYFRYGLHRTTIDEVWFYSAGRDCISIDPGGINGYGSYYNAITNCVFGDPADFSSGIDSTTVKGRGIVAVGSVNRMTLSNCAMWRLKSHGVHINGDTTTAAAMWSIRDSSIENCGYYNTADTYGIYIDQYATDINIVDNVFEYNGAFSSGLGAAIYCNAILGVFNATGNYFVQNPYGILISNCSGATINGNIFSPPTVTFDIRILTVWSGIVSIGANFSPNGTLDKYLSVDVPSQPKVNVDISTALLRGNTCAAGGFVPQLWASNGTSDVQISATTTGQYYKVGNKLNITFKFTITNKNGATGTIYLTGASGLAGRIPGNGVAEYNFINSPGIVPAFPPVYLYGVTLSAGATWVGVKPNQTGGSISALTEIGTTILPASLLATAIVVGSQLEGEFTVTV
jgi:hypothetical protein